MAEKRRCKFVPFLSPRYSKSLGSKTWKNNTMSLKRRMNSAELILRTSLYTIELKLKCSQQLDLNDLRVSHPETVRKLQTNDKRLLVSPGKFIILQLRALTPGKLMAHFPNLREILLHYVLIAKEEVALLHSLCNSFNIFQRLFYRPKNWLAEKESVKCFLESKNFLRYFTPSSGHSFETVYQGKNKLTIYYEGDAIYFNLHMMNPSNINLLSHISSIHLYIPKNGIHLFLSAFLNSSLSFTLKYVVLECVGFQNNQLSVVSFLRKFIVDFTVMRYFRLGRPGSFGFDSSSYLWHYIFVERINLTGCIDYSLYLPDTILERRYENALRWYGQWFHPE